MDRSKRLYQRPTIENGDSIDKVLAYPATTMAEYKAYPFYNWGYDYDHIGKYHSFAKKEILQSITESELRTMIAEKRRNVEFNERLVFSKSATHYMSGWLNEVYVDMINKPLIDCIMTLDRELRDRMNDRKKNQVDLDELKQRVDILDLIQSYVGIGRYKPGSLIKCPLHTHEDGSASFMIYPKNNTWHCFGCHAGSSQIDFIMKMDNCSVRDAIKKLSNF